MATDLNNVTIIGRLTRDVELSYTPGNNTALAKFSIANNEYRGNNQDDQVSYFDIVVWGRMAEVCNQFLTKGRQAAISGRLRQERFQDKSGQNRSKVVIVASNLQFIGGRNENNQGSNNGFSQGNQMGQRSPQMAQGNGQANQMGQENGSHMTAWADDIIPDDDDPPFF